MYVICQCMCMCTCQQVHMCLELNLCMYIHLCEHSYVHQYACMRVCMHACGCMYVLRLYALCIFVCKKSLLQIRTVGTYTRYVHSHAQRQFLHRYTDLQTDTHAPSFLFYGYNHTQDQLDALSFNPLKRIYVYL